MLPTGPTASTTNSVWNTSQSAATIEYYLPDSFASGYTGKFRSSVYKWDDNENGFVYPPVHQKTFSTTFQKRQTLNVLPLPHQLLLVCFLVYRVLVQVPIIYQHHLSIGGEKTLQEQMDF